MESSRRSFPIAPRALLELQLSDWQMLLEQTDLSPEEIREANRQIGRIKIELAADPMPGLNTDTHVRTPTHADEPAFVVVGEFDGLSKREYMATQLMAGMVPNKGAYYNPMEVADWAVGHADALIKTLNQ